MVNNRSKAWTGPNHGLLIWTTDLWSSNVVAFAGLWETADLTVVLNRVIGLKGASDSSGPSSLGVILMW